MSEVTVGKDLSSRIIAAFPYDAPLPSQVITRVIARPEKNAAISIPFSLPFSIIDPRFPSKHKTCNSLCHSCSDNNCFSPSLRCGENKALERMSFGHRSAPH